VINHLTDGKSTHIPYRDSKLTRLLQESLGGNSKTTLMLNCSVSSYNENETISTLRFGQRAKRIKNQAKVNLQHSPEDLKRMLEVVKKDLVLEQARVADLEQMLQSGATLEGRPESVEVPQQGMQELMAIREDLEGQLEELTEEVEMLNEVQNELLEGLQDKEAEIELLTKNEDAARLQAEGDSMLENFAELKFDNEKNELLIEDLTRKLTYTEEELARLTLEMPQSAQEMKDLQKINDMKISTPTAAAPHADGSEAAQHLARCELWIKQHAHNADTVLQELRTGNPAADEPLTLSPTGDCSRCHVLENKVEEQTMVMSDQAAQFDEWKNVIKLELDSKCARIVAIEKELNEEKENNKIMMGSGNHDLLQARNTMSMARRLRTQDNEIVALQRVKRELEQEKQTHLKMIASRDDRIRHLDSQAERHCRSDSMNKSQTPSPHRLSPFQSLGKIVKPLRGGGRRRSPLVSQKENSIMAGW